MTVRIGSHLQQAAIGVAARMSRAERLALTTRNLISYGIIALHENPGELARLRADRSLMPSAIDEMLRWGTPVMNFRRTATRDTELGGQQISEGDKVVFWHISANRDETMFPDPYRFDIGRSPNYHQAFGHGAHFCLGANLARWELRAVLRALLPLLPRLELVGEPVRFGHLHLGALQRQVVRLRS